MLLLTVWGPRTCVGALEDELEAILPISERPVKGDYTEQCQNVSRLLPANTLFTLREDPPDQGDASGCYCSLYGSQALLLEPLKISWRQSFRSPRDRSKVTTQNNARMFEGCSPRPPFSHSGKIRQIKERPVDATAHCMGARNF